MFNHQDAARPKRTQRANESSTTSRKRRREGCLAATNFVERQAPESDNRESVVCGPVMGRVDGQDLRAEPGEHEAEEHKRPSDAQTDQGEQWQQRSHQAARDFVAVGK
jgi:hypothetical protein